MNRQQQTVYERWCVEQRIVKMEDLIQSSHYKALKLEAEASAAVRAQSLGKPSNEVNHGNHSER